MKSHVFFSKERCSSAENIGQERLSLPFFIPRMRVSRPLRQQVRKRGGSAEVQMVLYRPWTQTQKTVVDATAW